VVLENIARRQKYPCANRERGCLELFSIEHIAKHQAVCVYGKIKCPRYLHESCSWNGLKNDLKEHAKAAHKKHYMERSKFVYPHLCGCFWFISCFSELFTYYQRRRSGRYYAAVQLIGTSNEASKYKCKFTLRAANGIEKISNTLLVHGYSEDWEKIFNSRNCLNLDEETLNIFVVDEKLKLDVKLSTV
jgi:hypothetical protein